LRISEDVDCKHENNKSQIDQKIEASYLTDDVSERFNWWCEREIWLMMWARDLTDDMSERFDWWYEREIWLMMWARDDTWYFLKICDHIAKVAKVFETRSIWVRCRERLHLKRLERDTANISESMRNILENTDNRRRGTASRSLNKFVNFEIAWLKFF
jgi:hypothetical protein